MSYTPPLDLLIELDFAPHDHDAWRCYLQHGPGEFAGETYYIQVTPNAETGITVVSYNERWPDGSLYKDTAFAGVLRDEAHFFLCLDDAGWVPC